MKILSSATFLLGMVTGTALLMTGLVLGGIASSPAVQEIQQTIRARQIEIVDELGTTVLALGANRDGGSISVRDNFGRTLLLMSAAESGGTIAVKSADRLQTVATMQARKTGGAIGIRAVDGESSATLDISDDQLPQFALAGSDDQPRVLAGATAAGNGYLETRSPAGERLVALSATVGNHGQISTHAPGGGKLVNLTATANDEGQLYTYNDAGLPLVALATQPNGPTVRIFNMLGEPIITLDAVEGGDGEIGVFNRDGAGTIVTANEPVARSAP